MVREGREMMRSRRAERGPATAPGVCSKTHVSLVLGKGPATVPGPGNEVPQRKIEEVMTR